MIIVVKLGSTLIRYHFHDDKTIRFFHGFVSPNPDVEEAEQVSVPYGKFEYYTAKYKQSNSFLEYNMVFLRTAHALLRHQSCLFHAAAFSWQNRAWLLAGPGGIGKTTQLFQWLELEGERIQIINGDKPILEDRRDGSIWVHPSPWCGKERLSGGSGAALGGIIFLERGEENSIEQLAVKDSVVPIYSGIYVLAKDEGMIHQTDRLAEAILQTTPVWKLRNRGDMDAAILTRDTLQHYLEESKKNG